MLFHLGQNIKRFHKMALRFIFEKKEEKKKHKQKKKGPQQILIYFLKPKFRN